MAMRDMQWTPEQARAVTATGDVLLAASAGTGKTTTVVGKILWQLGLEVGTVADTGEALPPCVHPCRLDQVAAITFTEKAAYDLKRKLREAIETSEKSERLRWELDRAAVGTIHGFCGDLLREHSLRLGIDPTFRVLDEREAQIQLDRIVRDVLMRGLEEGRGDAVGLVKRFGLYDQGRRAGAITHLRTVLRDLRWHAEKYRAWIEERDDPAEPPTLDARRLDELAERIGCGPIADGSGGDRESLEVAAALYVEARRCLSSWLAWLEDENLRDFDSLILDARRLLTRDETRPALEAIRARFRLFIIDEFQDTDAAQRDIAFAVAGLDHAMPVDAAARPQLFLVGDPQQSIYGFRGADIAVWNSVRERMRVDGTPLRLTHNFRSEAKVVGLVNRVCSRVMGERARDLAEESSELAVEYAELRAARPPTAAAGTEWLVVDEKKKADATEAEARLVASRIRDLVGRTPVQDPEDGRLRPCAYRDIAVLGRTRDALSGIEAGLRQYGVPFYNTATSGLADRQEVLDLVTALRLIENPHDDLRAFAYLRSPFVGLRDEVLARIRLDPDGPRTSYLRQAESFLRRIESGELDPYPATESGAVLEVELEALRTGLAVVRDAHLLVDRADHAELLEEVLERTGYRLHLLLREGAAESLANLERFQALLADYRHLPLGSFLALWDRWGEQDLGVPQAPLHSYRDDVVTLCTIHSAKGLEWPVVFLVRTREGVGTGRMLTNAYWSDRELGPVFMPVQASRGPRSRRAFERALLAEHAEEARLLYVGATRARDRLVISGPVAEPAGFAAWLAPALDEAIEASEARARLEALRMDALARPKPDSPSGLASAAGSGNDDATRTGSQIDAFGFDHDSEDPNGQFSLFAPPPRAIDAPAARGEVESVTVPDLPTVVYRTAQPIQQSLSEVPISLAWLEGIEVCDPPDIVRPIAPSAYRFTTSATELRMRELYPEEWELRYQHGVVPVARFAPSDGADGRLPATVRGTLIHEVLERIHEEAELARILNEAIAGLESPESETLLEPGTVYREALEEEIAAVIRSPEWAWYVRGEHWRELAFLHLAGPREWRIGAYDLYRPPESPSAGRDGRAWIVDFKTHAVEASQVAATARSYGVQALVYREAATAVLGSAAAPAGAGSDRSPVGVLLHFTRPNVAVEV